MDGSVVRTTPETDQGKHLERNGLLVTLAEWHATHNYSMGLTNVDLGWSITNNTAMTSARGNGWYGRRQRGQWFGGALRLSFFG